ncbi:hypothetical protein H072_1000 [Dactylellina haptotyla CBS 200.50]|uniref:Uncharacterized protein n=1 Tax=Dactylellina haptotyla (strain CBS 200.50) TaxID=1284197 RepID=S8BZT4_DACHA|nr:hypothetical protein H072_1000 [Dactylellina haptotyla CBS 200.50]
MEGYLLTSGQPGHGTEFLSQTLSSITDKEEYTFGVHAWLEAEPSVRERRGGINRKSDIDNKATLYYTEDQLDKAGMDQEAKITILVQGPTFSGKSSLVHSLINNSPIDALGPFPGPLRHLTLRDNVGPNFSWDQDGIWLARQPKVQEHPRQNLTAFLADALANPKFQNYMGDDFEDTEKNSSILAISLAAMEGPREGCVSVKLNEDEPRSCGTSDKAEGTQSGVPALSEDGVASVAIGGLGRSKRAGKQGNGKRFNDGQDSNDPNRKKLCLEIIESGGRWGCPFAKAYPDKHLHCWFINRADLSGIKQHISRYHYDLVDDQQLREAKTYEILFDLCIPDWGNKLRPSHVWDFAALIKNSDRYRAMEQARRMSEVEELLAIARMPNPETALVHYLSTRFGIEANICAIGTGTGASVEIEDPDRDRDISEAHGDAPSITRDILGVPLVSNLGEADLTVTSGELSEASAQGAFSNKGAFDTSFHDLDVSWMLDVANSYKSPQTDNFPAESIVNLLPELIPPAVAEGGDAYEQGVDHSQQPTFSLDTENESTMPPSSVSGYSSVVYTSSAATLLSSHSSHPVIPMIYTAPKSNVSQTDWCKAYKVLVSRKKSVRSTVELSGPKTFLCKSFNELDRNLTPWLESTFCDPSASFNWGEWSLEDTMTEERLDNIEGVINQLEFDPYRDSTAKYFIVKKE